MITPAQLRDIQLKPLFLKIRGNLPDLQYQLPDMIQYLLQKRITFPAVLLHFQALKQALAEGSGMFRQPEGEDL